MKRTALSHRHILALPDRWDLKWFGAEDCWVKEGSFHIYVVGNEIKCRKGTAGHIAADGSLSFRTETRFKFFADQKGKVDGRSGSGKYRIIDTRCYGTFKTTKAN